MPKIQTEDSTPTTEFKLKLRTDVQAKVLVFNSENSSSAMHVVTESFHLLIDGDKDLAEFWKQKEA